MVAWRLSITLHNIHVSIASTEERSDEEKLYDEPVTNLKLSGCWQAGYAGAFRGRLRQGWGSL